MRSPEERRNCIISKEVFLKKKMTEKILGKTICCKFMKSVSYNKFQPNYIIKLLTTRRQL